MLLYDYTFVFKLRCFDFSLADLLQIFSQSRPDVFVGCIICTRQTSQIGGTLEHSRRAHQLTVISSTGVELIYIA